MPTKKQLEDINKKLMKRVDCVNHVADQMEEFLKDSPIMPHGLTFEKQKCVGCRLGILSQMFVDLVIHIGDEMIKATEENKELREQFDNLIDLIKTAESEDQLKALKELNYLNK
tara:strand:+ start:305 stop:646 length:342 start_codon:yes stop_codon:yes gene_type:complete